MDDSFDVFIAGDSSPSPPPEAKRQRMKSPDYAESFDLFETLIFEKPSAVIDEPIAVIDVEEGEICSDADNGTSHSSKNDKIKKKKSAHHKDKKHSSKSSKKNESHKSKSKSPTDSSLTNQYDDQSDMKLIEKLDHTILLEEKCSSLKKTDTYPKEQKFISSKKADASELKFSSSKATEYNSMEQKDCSSKISESSSPERKLSSLKKTESHSTEPKCNSFKLAEAFASELKSKFPKETEYNSVNQRCSSSKEAESNSPERKCKFSKETEYNYMNQRGSFSRKSESNSPERKHRFSKETEYNYMNQRRSSSRKSASNSPERKRSSSKKKESHSTEPKFNSFKLAEAFASELKNKFPKETEYNSVNQRCSFSKKSESNSPERKYSSSKKGMSHSMEQKLSSFTLADAFASDLKCKFVKETEYNSVNQRCGSSKKAKSKSPERKYCFSKKMESHSTEPKSNSYKLAEAFASELKCISSKETECNSVDQKCNSSKRVDYYPYELKHGLSKKTESNSVNQKCNSSKWVDYYSHELKYGPSKKTESNNTEQKCTSLKKAHSSHTEYKFISEDKDEPSPTDRICLPIKRRSSCDSDPDRDKENVIEENSQDLSSDMIITKKLINEMHSYCLPPSPHDNSGDTSQKNVEMNSNNHLFSQKNSDDMSGEMEVIDLSKDGTEEKHDKNRKENVKKMVNSNSSERDSISPFLDDISPDGDTVLNNFSHSKIENFKVLDDVGPDDLSSDSYYDSEDDMDIDELDALLDEDYQRQAQKAANDGITPIISTKIIMIEKNKDPFDVLPENWISVTHECGMPIYLHRPSRVISLSRPYFIGSASARKHSVPMSSIPCLQYKTALEGENNVSNSTGEKISEVEIAATNESDDVTDPKPASKCPYSKLTNGSGNSANVKSDPPGGEDMNLTDMPVKVETAEDRAAKSLDPDQVRKYCETLFQFEEITISRFPTWKDRRAYFKKEKLKNRPTLPQNMKLITCGNVTTENEKGNKNSKRKEFILNPAGKSAISVLHEYAQHALKTQPKYVYKETESTAAPFSATVILGRVEYATGCASSKKTAKNEAARKALKILIPDIAVVMEAENDKFELSEDLSFFNEVKIEDPRIHELSNRASLPSPYQILCECLHRNFGLGETNLIMEMKAIKHQKSEFIMKVGKHEAMAKCQNKREGKQLAAQMILQKLHPHINNWGSLLRLYNTDRSEREYSVKHQKGLLEIKNKKSQPNTAVLEKLKQEMLKLAEKKSETMYKLKGNMQIEELPKLNSVKNVDLW